MKALQEFKEFAVKGNVVDMAVGVVIGAGFGKIVSSLVADIITPILGIIIGGVNFKNLKLTLQEAVGDKPAVTWNYGSFLQAVFDFLTLARQAELPPRCTPPTFSWAADRFVLYLSENTRDGVRYRELGSWPLAGAEAAGEAPSG